MNIIIVGLGSVGKALVSELTAEGHNLVVIDIHTEKVEQMVNEYDVKGVVGNGASKQVLKEARVSSADLIIATTSQDELNVLCCIIAKKLGVGKTIARASKPEYLELFREDGDLGLSLLVNPQHEAALEISRMLRFPSAIKVNEFSEGKVELVEILTPENSPLVGLQLKELSRKFESKILICAVQRNGEPIIPTGNFTIQAKDRLFITATLKNIYAFFKELGWNKQSRNIIIVGGSTTAFYLCEELEKINAEVKLIEKSESKCQELSERLSSTEILFGDGTDQELLRDEGIENADAFVALGDIDEQNIIMSMFASSLEVPKVITKIDQLSYYDMLQRSGIYSAISTKTSTAEQIIRFVRLMSNKKGSGVERLFRIIDDKAEVLEFETEENFRRLDVPIQDLPLKKDLLIAGIIRDKKLITPSGKDCIKYDDNVIVVTLHEGLNNLNDILDF